MKLRLAVLLLFTAPAAFAASADLRAFFNYGDTPVHPGLPFPVDVIYLNLSETTAVDTRLTLEVPGALTVRGLAEGCTTTATRATCAVGDLAHTAFPGGPRTFPFEVVAPEASDARLEATVTIESATEEAVPADNRFTASPFRTYRTFFVTNAADAGEGSFRNALQAANSGCIASDPCLVAFRIPALTGVATIRPLTPLPVVTAGNLLIDGLTQARYFADENPAGPEIELRGSSLTEGDGLVIAVPCEATVQGLAITGFPRHALYLTSTAPCPAQGYVRSGHQIRQNYLGVDASGTTAVPNLRGIYSDGGLPPRIEENVISGNTRAGVFIVSGAVFVRGNTIGLDPTGTRPLGNGASGIYFGAAAGGSEATGNHIAFNHEAGVAVDASARYVTVHRNAIHANYQTAIDHGLDGPTSALPIAAPEITSARYDAATNTTTILMTLPPPQVTESYSTSIDVYANDAPDPTGFGEAQTYLGTATFLAGVPQLTYRGDLRAKAIAAQAILRTFTETDGSFTTSSEIGRALAVTE